MEQSGRGAGSNTNTNTNTNTSTPAATTTSKVDLGGSVTALKLQDQLDLLKKISIYGERQKKWNESSGTYYAKQKKILKKLADVYDTIQKLISQQKKEEEETEKILNKRVNTAKEKASLSNRLNKIKKERKNIEKAVVAQLITGDKKLKKQLSTHRDINEELEKRKYLTEKQIESTGKGGKGGEGGKGKEGEGFEDITLENKEGLAQKLMGIIGAAAFIKGTDIWLKYEEALALVSRQMNVLASGRFAGSLDDFTMAVQDAGIASKHGTDALVGFISKVEEARLGAWNLKESLVDQNSEFMNFFSDIITVEKAIGLTQENAIKSANQYRHSLRLTSAESYKFSRTQLDYTAKVVQTYGMSAASVNALENALADSTKKMSFFAYRGAKAFDKNLVQSFNQQLSKTTGYFDQIGLSAEKFTSMMGPILSIENFNKFGLFWSKFGVSLGQLNTAAGKEKALAQLMDPQNIGKAQQIWESLSRRGEMGMMMGRQMYGEEGMELMRAMATGTDEEKKKAMIKAGVLKPEEAEGVDKLESGKEGLGQTSAIQVERMNEAFKGVISTIRPFKDAINETTKALKTISSSMGGSLPHSVKQSVGTFAGTSSLLMGAGVPLNYSLIAGSAIAAGSGLNQALTYEDKQFQETQEEEQRNLRLLMNTPSSNPDQNANTEIAEIKQGDFTRMEAWKSTMDRIPFRLGKEEKQTDDSTKDLINSLTNLTEKIDESIHSGGLNKIPVWPESTQPINVNRINQQLSIKNR